MSNQPQNPKCSLSELSISNSLQSMYGTELNQDTKTIDFGGFSCCSGTGVFIGEGKAVKKDYGACCGLIPRVRLCQDLMRRILIIEWIGKLD